MPTGVSDPWLYVFSELNDLLHYWFWHENRVFSSSLNYWADMFFSLSINRFF